MRTSIPSFRFPNDLNDFRESSVLCYGHYTHKDDIFIIVFDTVRASNNIFPPPPLPWVHNFSLGRKTIAHGRKLILETIKWDLIDFRSTAHSGRVSRNTVRPVRDQIVDGIYARLHFDYIVDRPSRCASARRRSFVEPNVWLWPSLCRFKTAQNTFEWKQRDKTMTAAGRTYKSGRLNNDNDNSVQYLSCRASVIHVFKAYLCFFSERRLRHRVKVTSNITSIFDSKLVCNFSVDIVVLIIYYGIHNEIHSNKK